MVDYRVRFVGDLGNLAQFDRAVQNSLGQSAQALQQANTRIAQGAGVGPLIDPKTSQEAGRFVANQKTIVDSINRTFIQSGDQLRRYISGYVDEVDKATGHVTLKPVFSEEYLASFKKVEGNYDRYLEQQKSISTTEAQIASQRAKHNAEQAANIEKQIELERILQGSKLSLASYASNTIADESKNNETYKQAITRLEGQIALVESGTLTKPDYTIGQTRGANGQFGAKIPPNESFTNLLSGIGTGGYVYTDRLEKALEDRKNSISTGKGGLGGTQVLNPAEIANLQKEAATLEDILQKIPLNIEQSRAPLTAALQQYNDDLAKGSGHIGQSITALETQLARLEETRLAGVAQFESNASALRSANPAYAARDAALSSNPPINAALQRALTESKDLQKQLLAGGLGSGERFNTDPNSGFAKALAQQEAAVTKYTRNIRTGVTTIEGSLKRYNEATKAFDIDEKFTADIDKNGKVITRWGGQLSGTGSILRQTVRDFQKVIEWTIATTAVFGTLGLAISSLKTINDLNTALTRFSITAQVSLGDANKIFKDLGQVAIDTATPLTDLIKVADDIALATKTAGDSTDEWKKKIIDLTTAVGIFTNLTGEDTVQGADKLTSAFKQLALAPKDLISVLNKVTAVAGGQSTAINDIVTSLGGVAEAGKAAGLTLDDQIALVQTLGQVTNKSAADTATAFKNLFGAISSPGSEKILKEFGISIRDASGGLKPFLDIYREINKAIADGVIPAGRIQDVLRGISGGPRRAPDAAALLGNLPAVETAIGRSVGATNEALIANAKILDTNQAKIQQLKNAFDIALFEKFGKVVQDATASISGFLTILLELFNKIDPQLISLLVPLAAALAAGKGLALLFARLGPVGVGAFGGIRKAISNAAHDLVLFGQSSYIKTQLDYGLLPQTVKGPLQPTARSVTAGLLSTTALKAGSNSALEYIKNLGALRTTLLLVGATAAVTIGQHAASGGLKIDPQTIGSVLQLAGSFSLATQVFAPLGVVALAAGTALQFLGNQADDATTSAHDASVSVSESIQKLKAAREDVTTQQAAQAQAKQELDAITASGKKDVATKNEQAQATNTFITATLALADANKVVSDSYDELLNKIPQLGEAYKNFKDLAKTGFIPPDQIKLLSEQLAAEILKVQGLGSLNTSPVTGPVKIPPAVIAPTTQVGNTGQYAFDQNLLKPENLKKLFDVNTGESTGIQIPASAQNIGLLSQSLNDLITGKEKFGLDPNQIDILTKAIRDWINSVDTVSALQNKAASDQALIQARGTIGALSGPELISAQDRASIVSALAANARGADVGPAPDKETRLGLGGYKPKGVSLQQVQDLIGKISAGEATGTPINAADLKDAADQSLIIKGAFSELAGLNIQDRLKAEGEELVKMGVSSTFVEKTLGLIPGTLTQSADELQRLQDLANAFDTSSNSALTKFAQRNAALLQQKNSGAFDKNASGLKALTDQSVAAYNAESNLNAIFKELATGSEAQQASFAELQKQLSSIAGLEDAAIVPADQLSGSLIDLAINSGVSAKGIAKIREELAQLAAEGQILSDAITTFHLVAVVDTSQAITQLRALAKAMAALAPAVPSIIKDFLGVNPIQGYIDNINRSIAALQGGNKSSKSLIDSIKKLLSSGKGSNLGALPKSSGSSGTGSAAASGPNVSTLDLPTEIATASNRSTLIQEAIKNARSLQSKVPGATKDARNDIVELLKGTQRILEVRGVKDDYLRKALEELAAVEKKRLDFETKADTIRRIRIGSGSFAAIANVPVNSTSGVSLGSPNGPINVTLNLNGTVLTPAQLAQFADLVASALKRQIATG